MERYIKNKYLYEKVYLALSDKIAKGEYLANEFLPSEQNIGQIYDVDRTTVRKALKMLVDDGIVKKIPGIGTKVMALESKPKSRVLSGNNSIAFLLPRSRSRENRIVQPFYSMLFYNIELACRNHGYQVFYSTLDETDDVETIDSIIRNGSFAGIIFVSNIAKTYISYALERNLPCVIVNEYCQDIPSVLEDNMEGIYLSCSHLISLGHRKIAVIKGISDYTSSKERMRGYLFAMSQGNIPVCEEYVMDSEWDAASGYEAVEKCLRGMPPKQYPTAIVAFNDDSAFGAIQAISQFNLRVPDDISVIGFDNVEQAQFSVPRLTTVDTSIPLMAFTAVENLLHQIADGHSNKVKILTPAKLVIRDSVAPPKDFIAN